MKRKHNAEMRRFAASVLIALPMTITLLFLMTRLILPSERDPIITRMIQNIEFHRTVRPPEPTGIQAFEPPPRVKVEPAPAVLDSTFDSSNPAETQEVALDENPAKKGPAHVIDWWAEARKIAHESDEEALKRWLLEQGYDRYVTIMQGPLPITNSVRGTLPQSQEGRTGYLNTYGDLEFKISENCVVQTQVSARLDISDFTRNLPMRVVCKPAPKVKLLFDRDDLK